MHKARIQESLEEEPVSGTAASSGYPPEEGAPRPSSPSQQGYGHGGGGGGGGGKLMHIGGKSPPNGAMMAARLAEQAAQRQAGLPPGYMNQSMTSVHMQQQQQQQQLLQQQQQLMQQRQMRTANMSHMMDHGGGGGGPPGGWQGMYPGGRTMGGMMAGPMGGIMGDPMGGGGQGMTEQEMMYRHHMMTQMSGNGGRGSGSGGGGMYPSHMGDLGGGGGPQGVGSREDDMRMQKLLTTLRIPTSQEQGTSAEVLGMLKSDPRLMASVINNQVCGGRDVWGGRGRGNGADTGGLERLHSSSNKLS